MKNKNNVKIFKPRIFLIAFCAAVFLLMEAVFTSIYIFVYSDITLSSGILPVILELLMKFIEIFAFGVCYALVIFYAITDTRKMAFSLCGIYVCATLLRRALSLAISYLNYGFIDGSDIYNVSVYSVFEILQILFVLISALIVSRSYTQKNAIDNVNGKFYANVYSKGNPFKKCAITAGIMLAAVNVGMRIFYDVSYGAPDGIGEVLIMTAYYLSDVLAGVLLCAVCLFSLVKLSKKQQSE